MNSPDDAGAMKTNHTDIKSFDKGPHFRADSALLEFLGLRLTASSPAECKAKPFVVRVRRTRRLVRSKSAGITDGNAKHELLF
jgi:hypothetical protein